MRGTIHPKMQHKCGDCNVHNSGYFCNFSPTTLKNFESIKVTNGYAKGSHLFREGQPTEGVFVLCRGRVKLTTHSQNGKALILRIATPGEVLGLSATITDSNSESTAEALEPCQVNFVQKSDFRRFVTQNPDAAVNALEQLSLQYKRAYMQIRSLGLSTCVADKLAALLLEWSENVPTANGTVHLHIAYSHEEMAEMIGTSRETVTRVLKEFRERGLISLKRSDLQIRDRRTLEVMVGNGKRSDVVQNGTRAHF